MAETTKKRSWYLLGAILATLHTALILLVFLLAVLSGDTEAGMAFFIFVLIDFPIGIELLSSENLLGLLIFGGILWFLYGFTVQSLLRIRSIKSALPFGIGVLGIAFFFLLPELYLASLPDWQEHWKRGWRAAGSDNLDLAIEHVAQAAQLAPKDQHVRNGIWDYLGSLYMKRQDFDDAEKAYLNALKVVASRSESRPNDYLNCHNQLGWLYRRVEKPEQEAEHLREAIRYNRLIYERDTSMGAGNWHRLAEIAYAQGETGEAFSMQNKAIEMEEATSASDFSINYMKEQLEKWKAEQSPAGDVLKAAPEE